ncbi:MAG: metallophosphoesterase [Verrucomicrobiota bacterium]
MTRILHLSDPHFGASDPRVADAFLAYASANRPDVTILSGDLTMRARRAELTASLAFTQQLPTPLVVIPGNHDIPAFNHPFDRFFRPFRRYRSAFGNDLEPELDLPGCHIISLNSTRAFGFHADWSQGFLSPVQLSHISGGFDKTSPEKLRVVVLHHPLLKTGEKGREVVRPVSLFFMALAAAKADLVLCGHFHRSHITAEDGATKWQPVISQAPTVCSTRLQGEPQGFHEIHAGGDHMKIVHFSSQNGGFAVKQAFEFQKTEVGWAAAN